MTVQEEINYYLRVIKDCEKQMKEMKDYLKEISKKYNLEINIE
jgi:hypothetical protein